MGTSVEQPSFWLRHEFLIRRLHSLSGLVPVGAYLVVHLATNASLLGGAAAFQDNVDRIHSLGPALPLIEWTFIFLPILFHAFVGVAIIWGALPNTTSYPYAKNVRYHLQRISGLIALVFIFYHVFQLHGWIKPWARPLGGAQFDHLYATSTAASALQSSIVIQLVYAVGVLACVYHLADGLWTAGITWGVWTSPAAQRRADRACVAFGLALAAVGLGALYGVRSADPQAARAIEQRRVDALVNSGRLDPREVHAPPLPDQPPAGAKSPQTESPAVSESTTAASTEGG